MNLDRTKIIPLLKMKKNIKLYPMTGKVYSASAFAHAFGHLLSNHEKQLLADRTVLFKQRRNDKTPLISQKELAIERSLSVDARSLGSRSALFEKNTMKLKGCRMSLESDVGFPHEQLRFGEEKMITTKIPFGVLSAENVMRELLAYCFFRKHRLPINHVPVSVFEYHIDGNVVGYGLVSRTQCEQRMEANESYDGLTVKEFIFTKILERKTEKRLTKTEADFGVDCEWYAKEKSRLLIKMNFYGGFRGVLNSNLGNDLVCRGKLFICDFDTFCVLRIPPNPSSTFLKNFVLWCTVELLKTSPLVLDFLDTRGMSNQERTANLWSMYQEKSLLWKHYRKRFFSEAKKRGWNMRSVNKAFQTASKTEVFSEIILDNVLNMHVITSTYPPDLSFYTPQGV